LSNERIKLWRSAIRQFKQYGGVKGVFYESGYNQFRVERGLDEDLKPDIIGWSTLGDDEHDRYFILELTMNILSKDKQLKRYKDANPKLFTQIGIQTSKGPEVLLGTDKMLNGHDDFCQLLFRDKFECMNANKVDDQRLRKCMEKASGQMDLTKCPEVTFRLIPESTNFEIREGIASSILQMFAPDNENITSEEIMKQSLDILFDHITQRDKNKLVNKITVQMDHLVKSHLNEYIEITGEGEYSLLEKGKRVHMTPNSMEAVELRVSKWVRKRQSTLPSFIGEDDT